MEKFDRNLMRLHAKSRNDFYLLKMVESYRRVVNFNLSYKPIIHLCVIAVYRAELKQRGISA